MDGHISMLPKNNVTADFVDEFASDQPGWVRDFAAVFDKVLANGYNMTGDLVEADYSCCTRNPPSKAPGKKEPGFDCHEDAVCT